jgi:antirestriction protein
LTDALEFIDEHGEDNFNAYYESYIEAGEACGYAVVDAFIEEEGFCDVEHCQDAFVGVYASGADFAEELVEEQGGEIPSFVIVDYEETWERSLSYDYNLVEKGYRNCYIFRKWF